MTKHQLREFNIQKRLLLSETEYTTFNIQLSNNFFMAVDLAGIKTIHVFIPIKKNREPDTRLIIERIKTEFSNINLVVPRIKYQTDELEHVFFEGEQQLEENKWGIPEPKFGVKAIPQDVDLIIVPLLAFDKVGHRVGYGKGFYDRFLSQCRKDCKKVGLSFFPPISKIDDIDTYDQTLNMVITPDEIFNF